MAASAKPKMKWKPAPAELVRRFDDAIKGFPQAKPKKIFGYPAAFVNGNMMAGLFQDSMMVRLAPDDLAAFREATGAELFEPMPGRVMREYAVVPQSIVKSEAKLRRVLADSLRHASSLPAKVAKARRTKA
jgi:TfoX/Sxy family transcriptional regulator of competence genes